QKPSNLEMPSQKNIRCACVTNKSHCSWSVKEKLIVLCYLKHINSMRATVKRFEIEPKQQAQYPLLEEKLVDWIEELRSMQNAVTRNMVIRKAKALAQTDEIKNAYPNILSFKFSINWLSRFLY
ncbi:29259_t:CDS:2, partial [Gigaspora margarita]